MELFLKYQTTIFRSLGIIMLLISFVVYFWAMPKEELSENDKAALRVARMEAQVAGKVHTSSKNSLKKGDSDFLQNLKQKQQKQLQYVMIFLMLFGATLLVYSFIKKKES